jgi:protein-disulfide isomerase
VNNKSLGGPLIAAAALMALSILGSGFVMSSSLDRGTEKLDTLVAAIKDMPAPVAAAPVAVARAGKPDPNKRYDIKLANSPVKGPKDASIEIVEWSDFQCPYCSRVGPTLEQVQEAYPNDVKIAFKHMPLSFHAKAPAAHAAAEAAHRQGKFWEMHDKIFAAQKEMSEEKYLEWAQEMGLDMEKFKKDIASKEVKDTIASDTKAASKLGVTGTPTLFINGRFLSGAQPFDKFKTIIDEELKKKS